MTARDRHVGNDPEGHKKTDTQTKDAAPNEPVNGGLESAAERCFHIYLRHGERNACHSIGITDE